MKIDLEQVAIEEALKEYLSNKGIDTQGKSVSMTFKNGRKAAGLTVSILLMDKPVAPEPAEVEAIPLQEVTGYLAKPEVPDEDDSPQVTTSATQTTSLFN